MHELIPITTSTIGQKKANTVNGRELHRFLEIGRDFPTWIKARINDYGFELGQDFLVTFPKTGERQNVVMKEYHLTLDMAKELSMLERNSMGKIARRYFIRCEEKANTLQNVTAELLRSNPLWHNIKRYTAMGLTRPEICKLVSLKKDTVRRHIRRMEACGILTPPPNLKELQALANRLQPLLPGMEA